MASSPVALATVAMTSPVAGFSTSNVSELDESTHFPLINNWVGVFAISPFGSIDTTTPFRLIVTGRLTVTCRDNCQGNPRYTFASGKRNSGENTAPPESEEVLLQLLSLRRHSGDRNNDNTRPCNS